MPRRRGKQPDPAPASAAFVPPGLVVVDITSSPTPPPVGSRVVVDLTLSRSPSPMAPNGVVIHSPLSRSTLPPAAPARGTARKAIHLLSDSTPAYGDGDRFNKRRRLEPPPSVNSAQAVVSSANTRENVASGATAKPAFFVPSSVSPAQSQLLLDMDLSSSSDEGIEITSPSTSRAHAANPVTQTQSSTARSSAAKPQTSQIPSSSMDIDDSAYYTDIEILSGPPSAAAMTGNFAIGKPDAKRLTKKGYRQRRAEEQRSGKAGKTGASSSKPEGRSRAVPSTSQSSANLMQGKQQAAHGAAAHEDPIFFHDLTPNYRTLENKIPEYHSITTTNGGQYFEHEKVMKVNPRRGHAGWARPPSLPTNAATSASASLSLSRSALLTHNHNILHNNIPATTTTPIIPNLPSSPQERLISSDIEVETMPDLRVRLPTRNSFGAVPFAHAAIAAGCPPHTPTPNLVLDWGDGPRWSSDVAAERAASGRQNYGPSAGPLVTMNQARQPHIMFNADKRATERETKRAGKAAAQVALSILEGASSGDHAHSGRVVQGQSRQEDHWYPHVPGFEDGPTKRARNEESTRGDSTSFSTHNVEGSSSHNADLCGQVVNDDTRRSDRPSLPAIARAVHHSSLSRTAPNAAGDSRKKRKMAAFCVHCLEGGHTSKKCPKTVAQTMCGYCGAVNAHSAKNCDMAEFCTECGKRGHLRKHCPQQRKPDTEGFCNKCGYRNHGGNICPSPWQTYDHQLRRGNAEDHVVLGAYDGRSILEAGVIERGDGQRCSRCSQRGHMSDHCPQNSPEDPRPSAFGVHNAAPTSFYTDSNRTLTDSHPRRPPSYGYGTSTVSDEHVPDHLPPASKSKGKQREDKGKQPERQESSTTHGGRQRRPREDEPIYPSFRPYLHSAALPPPQSSIRTFDPIYDPRFRNERGSLLGPAQTPTPHASQPFDFLERHTPPRPRYQLPDNAVLSPRTPEEQRAANMLETTGNPGNRFPQDFSRTERP